MDTFAISDIHGCFDALKALLIKSKFDYENDQLICLGDTCDRGLKIKECFDELFKIKNLIYILGNHDEWTLKYFNDSFTNSRDEESWYQNGGSATYDSFEGVDTIPYNKFLRNAKPYYIDSKNRLFVHGGINLRIPIENNSSRDLRWSRDFITGVGEKHKMIESSLKNLTKCDEIDISLGLPLNRSVDFKFSIYDEIFVGHTPTSRFRSDKPVHLCNVWDIDTGCYTSNGKLTLIDVDTKEFCQVDKFGK